MYMPCVKCACSELKLARYGRGVFEYFIYHIQPLNVDNRHRFYNLCTLKTYAKIRVSIQTRLRRNSSALFKMVESL